jgi:hypothetical protein
MTIIRHRKTFRTIQKDIHFHFRPSTRSNLWSRFFFERCLLHFKGSYLTKKILVNAWTVTIEIDMVTWVAFLDIRWQVGIHAYNNDLRSLSIMNGVIMAYLWMTPTLFGDILFFLWFFPHMIFLSETLSYLYRFSCLLLDFLILSLRWPPFDLLVSFFFGLWHWLGHFGLWFVLLWFSLFCFGFPLIIWSSGIY